jgi:hypothetical protein
MLHWKAVSIICRLEKGNKWWTSPHFWLYHHISVRNNLSVFFQTTVARLWHDLAYFCQQRGKWTTKNKAPDKVTEKNLCFLMLEFVFPLESSRSRFQHVLKITTWMGTKLVTLLLSCWRKFSSFDDSNSPQSKGCLFRRKIVDITI